MFCNLRPSLLIHVAGPAVDWADTNQADMGTWLASKVRLDGKESIWAAAN